MSIDSDKGVKCCNEYRDSRFCSSCGKQLGVPEGWVALPFTRFIELVEKNPDDRPARRSVMPIQAEYTGHRLLLQFGDWSGLHLHLEIGMVGGDIRLAVDRFQLDDKDEKGRKVAASSDYTLQFNTKIEPV